MAIHDSFYTKKFEDVRSFYKENETPQQVEFIERVIPLESRHKILDLACGGGRHSIELSKKGYYVVGHDQSGDFINQAKQEAKNAGVTVTFECKDMCSLDIFEEFDVILSLSTSLAFYDDQRNNDIFCRVHKALKPDGIFLFDQGNIFHLMQSTTKNDEFETTKLPDGRIHHSKRYFDAANCVLSRRSILEDGGEREESGWDIRYYTLSELRLIMKEIGFEIVGSYGDYDGSEYWVKSKRLITILKKI